jgi:hypothetical protein
MIYSEAKTARIHGVQSIRADAKEVRGAGVSWLSITTDIDDEITFFMPYETALEYANAINSCNDREIKFTEGNCPGHVGSDNDPKICALCGVHIDSLRPEDTDGALDRGLESEWH